MFFEQVCNQRKFDAVSQYLTPDFCLAPRGKIHPGSRAVGGHI